MKKNILIKAAILGCLAVIAGAFGAHAFEDILAPKQLLTYKTAARYQMYHAIVLLIVFILTLKFDSKHFKRAANFIFIGIILFSGSLYLLAFKEVWAIESLKFLGPVTPLGGLLMIVGWVFIIVGAIKLR